MVLAKFSNSEMAELRLMTRDQFIAHWGLRATDCRAFVRDLDVLLYSLPFRRLPENSRRRIGSRLNPKTLEIMTRMTRDGYAYREIAEHLNSIGLTARRGGKFTPQSVRQYTVNM